MSRLKSKQQKKVVYLVISVYSTDVTLKRVSMLGKKWNIVSSSVKLGILSFVYHKLFSSLQFSAKWSLGPFVLKQKINYMTKDSFFWNAELRHKFKLFLAKNKAFNWQTSQVTQSKAWFLAGNRLISCPDLDLGKTAFRNIVTDDIMSTFLSQQTLHSSTNSIIYRASLLSKDLAEIQNLYFISVQLQSHKEEAQFKTIKKSCPEEEIYILELKICTKK